ncbi:MAG: hypothetical protein KJ718_00215 [Nanoarchaeota archaeon]|nr:hypothetical protein [Nanoarchaeota archaeon]MBU1050964.1 hypothetical protein [Nanoarchaeota archaeon]MBU1988754.1 hypothetical protein [Nanoarchaeota archaeon]
MQTMKMKENVVSRTGIILLFLIVFLTIFFLNIVKADTDFGMGIELIVTDGDDSGDDYGDSYPEDNPDQHNQNDDNSDDDSDGSSHRSNNDNDNEEYAYTNKQLEENSNKLQPIKEKILLGSNNKIGEAKQPNQKILTIGLSFSSILLLLFMFLLTLSSNKFINFK